MIRRIILENYMSHSRTVIEPAAGLTVLIGPNNCGKSAVISALLCLRGDLAGDFMVRHGEKLCAVTVETDDDHTIVWRRKAKSVSYVIDGVEVHRAGRGNLPDQLPTTLRLPRIKPANSSDWFDLHFGLQKEPIFLINSESDAARFFSASNDAERLLEMQRLHKQKVQAARVEERTTKAELARIDRKLAALSPLEAIDEALVEAEKRHEQIVRATQQITDLGRLISAIERKNRERQRLQETIGALVALRPPPVPHDTPALRRSIERIEQTSRIGIRSRARQRALEDLRSPPPVEATEPLAEIIGKLARGARSLQRRRAHAEALEPLREAPALEDAAILRRMLSAYAKAEESVALHAGRVGALHPLHEPPVPREVAPLADLIARITRAATGERATRLRQIALSSLRDPPPPLDAEPLCLFIVRWNKVGGDTEQRRRTLLETFDKLEAASRQIEGWLAANPTCPVCGGPTDRARFLAGEHAHV